MSQSKLKKGSIINVKINEQEEIEYVTYDEETQDHSDAETITEIELEEDFDDSDDPDVITNPDGSMVIKMEKKPDIEHVCGKCHETFLNLEVHTLLS